jgi:peroxiredoxin
VLSKWEMWGELLRRAETTLAPSGSDDDEVKRLRALGAAYFATDDAQSGRFCIAGLEVLLQKRQPKKDDEKDEKKKDDSRKKTKPVENALAELRGLAETDPKAALDQFAKCEDLRKEVLAMAQLRAGDKEKAEKTAKQAADGAEGQAIQALAYVEILLQLGKQKEAEEAWRKVAPVIRDADPDLPILKRISLPRVELPPAKPVVEGIENLGPLAWAPPAAPMWTLNDAEGKPFSVQRCGDTPVLVLFYLGSKCKHCVEQLGKFAEIAGEFKKANIELVAVSIESQEELAAQKKSAKGWTAYPFPLLADPTLRIFKEYRCFDDFERMPIHGTFLIDADQAGRGRIRWQEISYEPFMDAPFLLQECKRLLSLSPAKNH